MVPAGASASDSELALAAAPEPVWEEASAPEPESAPESDLEPEPDLEPERDLAPEREREPGSDPVSELVPETEQVLAPGQLAVRAPVPQPAAREAVAPAFHSAPH